MTNMASRNQEFVDSLIGNINGKHITFYGTYSGLGLLISKAHGDAYVAIANDSSSLIPKPDLKLNCTDLNKWHLISVTWSDKGKSLSNRWCNGEKLITFATGNVKGSDHDYCHIGNFGRMPGLKITHLTGCIDEIIAFYDTIDDQKASHIHEYLMKKLGITNTVVLY